MLYTCRCMPTLVGFFQVGITALANLTAQYAATDPPRIFFSLEKVYYVLVGACMGIENLAWVAVTYAVLQEIIPFVWDHWDVICTKRSKAGSWRNNLATKLVIVIMHTCRYSHFQWMKCAFIGQQCYIKLGWIEEWGGTQSRSHLTSMGSSSFAHLKHVYPTSYTFERAK